MLCAIFFLCRVELPFQDIEGKLIDAGQYSWSAAAHVTLGKFSLADTVSRTAVFNLVRTVELYPNVWTITVIPDLSSQIWTPEQGGAQGWYQ